MNYKPILLACFHTGTPELFCFHGRVPVQKRLEHRVPVLSCFVFMAVYQCSSIITNNEPPEMRNPPICGGVSQTVQGVFQEKTGTQVHGHENKHIWCTSMPKRLVHRLEHGPKDWNTNLVCRKFEHIR